MIVSIGAQSLSWPLGNVYTKSAKNRYGTDFRVIQTVEYIVTRAKCGLKKSLNSYKGQLGTQSKLEPQGYSFKFIGSMDIYTDFFSKRALGSI